MERFEVVDDGAGQLSLIDNEERVRTRSIKDCCEMLNELNEEKKFWKKNCCFESNYVHILYCELNRIENEGYELSDTYKKRMRNLIKERENLNYLLNEDEEE